MTGKGRDNRPTLTLKGAGITPEFRSLLNKAAKKAGLQDVEGDDARLVDDKVALIEELRAEREAQGKAAAEAAQEAEAAAWLEAKRAAEAAGEE